MIFRYSPRNYRTFGQLRCVHTGGRYPRPFTSLDRSCGGGGGGGATLPENPENGRRRVKTSEEGEENALFAPSSPLASHSVKILTAGEPNLLGVQVCSYWGEACRPFTSLNLSCGREGVEEFGERPENGGGEQESRTGGRKPP